MSKTATPHLPFLADPSSAPRLPKTESSQIYDSSRQRPRQSDSVRLGREHGNREYDGHSPQSSVFRNIRRICLLSLSSVKLTASQMSPPGKRKSFVITCYSVPQRASLVRHTALKIRVVGITNESPIRFKYFSMGDMYSN